MSWTSVAAGMAFGSFIGIAMIVVRRRVARIRVAAPPPKPTATAPRAPHRPPTPPWVSE